MIQEKEKMSQAVKALTDKESKYLTFSLASEEYGICILKIKEIIGMMPITSVPQKPSISKVWSICAASRFCWTSRGS